MAEQLRISARSYSDLEKGRNSCCATMLMFLLLFIPEPEMLRLCADFRALVEKEDNHGAA